LVSGKVRWRGRPTASDELLGPGSSRDARRGRASVRSMVAIWVPLVAPLPSAVLMKAHRAPIICQACHQAPLFSAGETGEPGVPRRTGFFPPSQPLSGQRFLPGFAHLARGATDAGGLRRYKACAGRTCSRAARHRWRDRARALRVTFRRPCCGQPGGRCSRAPGFALYREARAAVLRCVRASRGFSHPAGRLYPPGAAVRASS
jgi:hypothetical protein